MNLSLAKYLSISSFLIALYAASNRLKKPKHSSTIISKESDCEKFIDITLEVLKDELSSVPKRQIRNILEWIYNDLYELHVEKLALFVAYSIYNTNFFNSLQKGNITDRFRARGLLGIKGEDEYKKITLSSKNRINYTKNPNLLSEYNQKVVEDTLNFFTKCRMRDFNYNSVISNMVNNGHNEDINVEIFHDIYSRLLHSYNMQLG